MRNFDQHNITEAVLSSFANASDPRLQKVLCSLVQHLHAFAEEVQLTETEWSQGIQFLTRCGQISDDKRQEFILLSDVLGLSTLMVAMNQSQPAGCTEATVLGPFHTHDAPACASGDDIARGAKGTPCVVRGTVKSLKGEPIAGAAIDVWHSDEEGLYDVQRKGLSHAQGRGRLQSDAQGSFHFRSVLAQPYPIPHDGPVGQMLEATGRHPWRPAHVHFLIQAPGYASLTTHLFRSQGEYLDSDAVFGVRQSLICDWVQQADGSFELVYDFVLNPMP